MAEIRQLQVDLSSVLTKVGEQDNKIAAQLEQMQNML